MCDPVTAGLILTAVGGGTKAANALISARRQDRATAAGIRRQAGIQQEASQRVREQVADVAASTPGAERAEALEGFLNTLRETEDITGAQDDPLALGGQRFAERVKGREAATRELGREQAEREAIIRGAFGQRQREAAGAGTLATSLREFGRRSQAEDFITRLHAASKRPNPLVDFLGEALTGAGSIVALRPPGGEDLLARLAGGTLVDAPVRAATPFSGVPV